MWLHYSRRVHNFSVTVITDARSAPHHGAGWTDMRDTMPFPTAARALVTGEAKRRKARERQHIAA